MILKTFAYKFNFSNSTTGHFYLFFRRLYVKELGISTLFRIHLSPNCYELEAFSIRKKNKQQSVDSFELDFSFSTFYKYCQLLIQLITRTYYTKVLIRIKKLVWNICSEIILHFLFTIVIIIPNLGEIIKT